MTYTVLDNDGNASSAVTVTIDYAVQVPVATADTVTGAVTNNPVTVDVLTNDSDPDGTLDPATGLLRALTRSCNASTISDSERTGTDTDASTSTAPLAAA